MTNEHIKLNETNTLIIIFLIHTSRIPFCIYTLSSKNSITFLYVQAKENNNAFSCVYCGTLMPQIMLLPTTSR